MFPKPTFNKPEPAYWRRVLPRDGERTWRACEYDRLLGDLTQQYQQEEYQQMLERIKPGYQPQPMESRIFQKLLVSAGMTWTWRHTYSSDLFIAIGAKPGTNGEGDAFWLEFFAKQRQKVTNDLDKLRRRRETEAEQRAQQQSVDNAPLVARVRRLDLINAIKKARKGMKSADRAVLKFDRQNNRLDIVGATPASCKPLTVQTGCTCAEIDIHRLVQRTTDPKHPELPDTGWKLARETKYKLNKVNGAGIPGPALLPDEPVRVWYWVSNDVFVLTDDSAYAGWHKLEHTIPAITETVMDGLAIVKRMKSATKKQGGTRPRYTNPSLLETFSELLEFRFAPQQNILLIRGAEDRPDKFTVKLRVKGQYHDMAG